MGKNNNNMEALKKILMHCKLEACFENRMQDKPSLGDQAGLAAPSRECGFLYTALQHLHITPQNGFICENPPSSRY